MGEHFCILFLFRKYHLQIVLYMKLFVLKSIFGYIHLLTSPKVQSFPLLGRIRDFHPLATCAARRTSKKSKTSVLLCKPLPRQACTMSFSAIGRRYAFILLKYHAEIRRILISDLRPDLCDAFIGC